MTLLYLFLRRVGRVVVVGLLDGLNVVGAKVVGVFEGLDVVGAFVVVGFSVVGDAVGDLVVGEGVVTVAEQAMSSMTAR